MSCKVPSFFLAPHITLLLYCYLKVQPHIAGSLTVLRTTQRQNTDVVIWPTFTILNSFPGLLQQLWQWLHLSHSHNQIVGDYSTVTTEEPSGELSYWATYSSVLLRVINTMVPAEPRLALHKIPVPPLMTSPGLHRGIMLPLQMGLSLSAGMLVTGFEHIYLSWA